MMNPEPFNTALGLQIAKANIRYIRFSYNSGGSLREAMVAFYPENMQGFEGSEVRYTIIYCNYSIIIQ